MNQIPFDRTTYNTLLSSKYRFIEITATGKEIQIDEELYKKEIILRLHAEKPEHSNHYIVDIDDPEIAELSHGSDTDVVFIEYMP